ncbi:MAG: hypothetical protein ABI629_02725 [bacterium]
MLPPLNAQGDLPPGIHAADWAAVAQRFGGTAARLRQLARLRLLHQLAARTGKLARFLVFGSFVSAVPAPRDVDVVLIMAADFRLEDAPRECRTLFAHADAEARYGASIFWVREGMLPAPMMQDFLATWQTKRDGARRGIVEVTT